MTHRWGFILALVLVAAARPARAADDDRLLLGEPFAQPPYSFFHAALGQPLLRAARTIGDGAILVQLRGSEVRSHESGFRDGQPNRFDGNHHELARLELRFGVHERVELYTALRLTGWDERRDVFRVFSGGTFPSVRGEREKLLLGRSTSRHENLADALVGAKGLVLGAADPRDLSGLALAVEIKVPASRPGDLTNAGTTDVSLALLGSLDLGPVVGHASASVVVPLGEQTIFVDHRPGLSPFGHAALGVTCLPTDFLSFGVGLEASTPTWHHVSFLDHVPATAAAGVRLVLGHFAVELGLGHGLTRFGADLIAWVQVGYRFTELWGASRPAPGGA